MLKASESRCPASVSKSASRIVRATVTVEATMTARDSASAKCDPAGDAGPSPSSVTMGRCAEFAVATDAVEWVAGFEPAARFQPCQGAIVASPMALLPWSAARACEWKACRTLNVTASSPVNTFYRDCLGHLAGDHNRHHLLSPRISPDRFWRFIAAVNLADFSETVVRRYPGATLVA